MTGAQISFTYNDYENIHALAKKMLELICQILFCDFYQCGHSL